MVYKDGTRFWCLTIEPPMTPRKKVYGKINHYIHSKNAYYVIWDTGTPLSWIQWTNNKIYPNQIHIIDSNQP